MTRTRISPRGMTRTIPSPTARRPAAGPGDLLGDQSRSRRCCWPLSRRAQARHWCTTGLSNCHRPPTRKPALPAGSAPRPAQATAAPAPQSGVGAAPGDHQGGRRARRVPLLAGEQRGERVLLRFPARNDRIRQQLHHGCRLLPLRPRRVRPYPVRSLRADRHQVLHPPPAPDRATRAGSSPKAPTSPRRAARTSARRTSCSPRTLPAQPGKTSSSRTSCPARHCRR